MFSVCAVNKIRFPVCQKNYWSPAYMLQSLVLFVCLVQLTGCGSSEDAVTPANTPVPNHSFKNYIELGLIPVGAIGFAALLGTVAGLESRMTS